MKFNLFNWGYLGRDFWLFRFGQVISVIGDACGNIAFAWWILDVTGSAAKMASIMAPAMFVWIFMVPLFGPIGDKFPRKWIIIIGDVSRGFLTLIIAGMVFFNFFNLPILMALYILRAVGSALFTSASCSIVPQLVPKDKLQKAMQQEQAVMSGGTIVGGITGGLLVSFLGIGGAFIIDGLSFFLAALASFLIKVNTQPPVRIKEQISNPIAAWLQELKEGFRVVIKIPIEFWLAIISALLNFISCPIVIALPVFAKETRHMPAWFLGALETSIAIGTIIGAIIVGRLCKKIYSDFLVVAGFMIAGVCIALLPWIVNPVFPIVIMFSFGVGLSIGNILVSTQTALAMPDEYRSRAGSIIIFLSQIATPFGIFFAGLMISGIGLSLTMLISGGLLALFTPLILLIPKFSVFFRLPPEKAGTFYTENYPDAFKNI